MFKRQTRAYVHDANICKPKERETMVSHSPLHEDAFSLPDPQEGLGSSLFGRLLVEPSSSRAKARGSTMLPRHVKGGNL